MVREVRGSVWQTRRSVGDGGHDVEQEVLIEYVLIPGGKAPRERFGTRIGLPIGPEDEPEFRFSDSYIVGDGNVLLRADGDLRQWAEEQFGELDEGVLYENARGGDDEPD